MAPSSSKTDVIPTFRPIRLSTLMLLHPLPPRRGGARPPSRGRRSASPLPVSPGSARPLGRPCPRGPFVLSHLDSDVDAGRHVELGQGVHRLRRRLGDEDQALVRPDLELLPR